MLRFLSWVIKNDRALVVITHLLVFVLRVEKLGAGAELNATEIQTSVQYPYMNRTKSQFQFKQRSR